MRRTYARSASLRARLAIYANRWTYATWWTLCVAQSSLVEEFKQPSQSTRWDCQRRRSGDSGFKSPASPRFLIWLGEADECCPSMRAATSLESKSMGLERGATSYRTQ